jgi:hypothetical protein
MFIIGCMIWLVLGDVSGMVLGVWGCLWHDLLGVFGSICGFHSYYLDRFVGMIWECVWQQWTKGF